MAPAKPDRPLWAWGEDRQHSFGEVTGLTRRQPLTNVASRLSGRS